MAIISTTALFALDTRAPQVSSLTTTPISGSSIQCDWSPALTETNFSHYELWYGLDYNDVQNRTGTASKWDYNQDGNLLSATTSTTTITGLTPDTPYYISIWGIDDFGQETRVEAPNTTSIVIEAASSIFALDTKPPDNLGGGSTAVATLIGGSVDVTWTAATDQSFNHYEIWYGTNQGDVQNRTGSASGWGPANDSNLSNIATTSTTVIGIPTGQTLYFSIFAIDAFGEVTRTDVVIPIVVEYEPSAGPSAFALDTLAPRNLTTLTVEILGYLQARCTWEIVTEPNFSHYEIWYGTNQNDVQNRTGGAAEWDDGDDPNLTSKATTTSVLTGLPVASNLYFSIFAIDVYGNETTHIDAIGTYYVVDTTEHQFDGRLNVHMVREKQFDGQIWIYMVQKRYFDGEIFVFSIAEVYYDGRFNVHMVDEDLFDGIFFVFDTDENFFDGKIFAFSSSPTHYTGRVDVYKGTIVRFDARVIVPQEAWSRFDAKLNLFFTQTIDSISNHTFKIYDAFSDPEGVIRFRAVAVDLTDQDPASEHFGEIDHWLVSHVEEWTSGAIHGELNIEGLSEVPFGSGHPVSEPIEDNPAPIFTATVTKNFGTILREGVDYEIVNVYNEANPYDINAFCTRSYIRFFKGGLPASFTRGDHLQVEYQYIREKTIVQTYTNPGVLERLAVVHHDIAGSANTILRQGSTADSKGNIRINGHVIPIPDIIIPDVIPFPGAPGSTIGDTLISAAYGSGRISQHSGFTSEIVRSFSSPGPYPQGIAWDGTNLISCDGTTGKVYLHNGFTPQITASFNTFAPTPSGVAWDGNNVLSCDFHHGGVIYKHRGFSDSIQDYFSSPGPNPKGLSWDGEHLYSADDTTQLIYQHSGFSSHILVAFNAPNTGIGDIHVDAYNVISAVAPLSRIYKHNGLTNQILDSFVALDGGTYGVLLNSIGFDPKVAIRAQIVEAINQYVELTRVQASIVDGRIHLEHILGQAFQLTRGTYPLTEFGFADGQNGNTGSVTAESTIEKEDNFSFSNYRRLQNRGKDAKSLLGQKVTRDIISLQSGAFKITYFSPGVYG